jgi:hypothetical protein
MWKLGLELVIESAKITPEIHHATQYSTTWNPYQVVVMQSDLVLTQVRR